MITILIKSLKYFAISVARLFKRSFMDVPAYQSTVQIDEHLSRIGWIPGASIR
jgi:hypothetical protein